MLLQHPGSPLSRLAKPAASKDGTSTHPQCQVQPAMSQAALQNQTRNSNQPQLGQPALLASVVQQLIGSQSPGGPTAGHGKNMERQAVVPPLNMASTAAFAALALASGKSSQHSWGSIARAN
ncbi:hypothetical protein HaLaN_19939 [Haematococcus lacustris]|uniref:Uncharacterized protein n=1 Tax=Haematococcus lacustris TaxID=44745 RepID=A0A699ZUR4_HAELA|nr:hypothetical protein HaLaN_19939 [Haematococcus lacustris]